MREWQKHLFGYLTIEISRAFDRSMVFDRFQNNFTKSLYNWRISNKMTRN